MMRPLPSTWSQQLPVHLIRTLKSARFLKKSHGQLQSICRKPGFSPSSQQLKIANLCAEQNVVVSARPGSGKTATIEAIAAAHPDKRIGSILFSKRLQSETSQRLKKYHNSDVFTFHGMAGVLFGRVVPSDKELIKRLEKVDRNGKLPRWTSTPFDIIVLDEFQDCGQSARIVVLGDERQSIYRFRGADPRYLTLASQLLGPMSPYPFTEVQLGKSFRLPTPTVKFINRVFLGGEQYITSSRHGPKPIVLRCNPWKSSVLAGELSPLIKRYGPENSVIIAPSVRKKGPLQNLTNTLAQAHGFPIHVPPDEDAPLDDQVINGKMCISTIHQFKGRERELVILLGMDSSYFKYFGRDLPDGRCPNEVFVALTRSLEQLVLVHNDYNKMMPCASLNTLHETAEIVNLADSQTNIPPPDLPGRPPELGLILPISCGAREITRYVQGDVLDKLVKRYVHIKRISSHLQNINIQNVVSSDLEKGLYESVSDINGLVIAAAFELEIAGTLKSLGLSKREVDRQRKRSPEKLVPWLCRQACKYEASLSGYLPRAIQMKNHTFDWIKSADLDLSRHRLDRELVDPVNSLDFEVQLKGKFNIEGQETQLLGRADIVATSPLESKADKSSQTIWEIKFVSQLSNEHIVQACAQTSIYL
ncbi:hypothetical protein F53441_9073 [Fusarium austroafricanum]|uniref:DNA helicase n=1 Tax=Fusarium austroafricanum TaxID=2364996 RepID=A0A8H4KBV6_9HYPO|nr:hypothetical protein F53441_9073 [Fusarium austroafricanum]